MDRRTRAERARRWREALRPDADLAQAEGLAAGLGLLTGDVARAVNAAPDESASLCESCGQPTDVVVVDLVARRSTVRCRACGRRATTDLTADRTAGPTPEAAPAAVAREARPSH